MLSPPAFTVAGNVRTSGIYQEKSWVSFTQSSVSVDNKQVSRGLDCGSNSFLPERTRGSSAWVWPGTRSAPHGSGHPLQTKVHSLDLFQGVLLQLVLTSTPPSFRSFFLSELWLEGEMSEEQGQAEEHPERPQLIGTGPDEAGQQPHE